MDNESSNRDEAITSIIDGRYYVESELGHGGIGVVYLARDRKLLDKLVVIKVLLEKFLKDEYVVQKFHQEREALARLDHPGVVGVLDTGELANGKPYLVIQYIDGVSLRDLVRANPEGMDLTRAALIINQIGAALGAVHQKRIYHRDLKPENIMVQRLGRGQEQVKILDFGLAKLKESLLASSTPTGANPVGTIRYMSPEQLRGDKLTAASDIYSFALIAYELVTGRRPFNPDTTVHFADLQQQGVYAKPTALRPRLSVEAEDLILSGLSFNAERRPKEADEFGERLARALRNDGETLKQRRDADSPPAPTPPVVNLSSLDSTLKNDVAVPRRSKKRLVAAALVVVAALTLGTFLMLNPTLFGKKASPPVDRISLAYSLTVQKMRDGKPYEQPFDSSGQEIFENGYKFRLNVSSPDTGYLYVINEGSPEADNTSFTFIYPTPQNNHGSARLEANGKVETPWNTFAGERGTEYFFIIWSKGAIDELEHARDEAFKHPEGSIVDATVIQNLENFLTQNAEPQPETVKDTQKKQTSMSATGNLLIKKLELEHR